MSLYENSNTTVCVLRLPHHFDWFRHHLVACFTAQSFSSSSNSMVCVFSHSRANRTHKTHPSFLSLIHFFLSKPTQQPASLSASFIPLFSPLPLLLFVYLFIGLVSLLYKKVQESDKGNVHILHKSNRIITINGRIKNAQTAQY